jgi:hypothetical protein
MKKTFSILSILLIALSLQAQTTNAINKVKQKILEADSVVLISHILTREFAPKIKRDYEKGTKKVNYKKWNSLYPPAPSFLINGKINRKIFVETISLTNSEKNSLINILVKRTTSREIKMIQCDVPRHSIIIYKNNKQSYIDICFGCKRINTSNDIAFSVINMDDEKWEDLQGFFIANGIKKLYNVFD